MAQLLAHHPSIPGLLCHRPAALHDLLSDGLRVVTLPSENRMALLGLVVVLSVGLAVVVVDVLGGVVVGACVS